MTVDGKSLRVHRLVYESEVGSIPAGFDVHHVCENRACINPSHLQALSRRDHVLTMNGNPFAENARKTYCKNGHLLVGENVKFNKSGHRICRECLRNAALRWKNRHLPMKGVQRGADHHHATLTEIDVFAIRAAVASGEAQRRVAARFGVGAMQVNRIVHRKQWTHI